MLDKNEFQEKELDILRSAVDKVEKRAVVELLILQRLKKL